MMKRIIALLLALMTALSSMAAAGAEPVKDKIDPVLRARIAAHTDDGIVVEIRFHDDRYPIEGVSENDAYYNAIQAEKELLKEIKAISYMEKTDCTLGGGRVLVGLPFDSIERVAELERIDYITLPDESERVRSPEEKIEDETLKKKLIQMDPDEKIGVAICFSYGYHYIYIGIDIAQCKTDEEMRERIRVKQQKLSEFYSVKNAEYAQKIAARAAAGGITAENISWWEYDNLGYVCTTVSEVRKFAEMPEVHSLLFADVPIDAPSHQITLNEKFNQWMKTKGFEKGDDSEPFKSMNEYRAYKELAATEKWALVEAHVTSWDPWEMVFSFVLGERVLSWWSPGAGFFPYGLFVYDAVQDTFIEIDKVDPEDYPGLTEKVNELALGRALGDADRDNDLTILDATAVQRDLADLKKLPKDDVYTCEIHSGSWMAHHYADYDRSGDLTILDATAIQRHLAEL